MKTIALINGPNLDRLGKREPQISGRATLADIVSGLRAEAEKLGAEIADFQSNCEGAIIDKIYGFADSGVKLGIINPGALAHTSVALRDCIAGSGMTFVEVHISNVARREDFRHLSLTAPVCAGSVAGLGAFGYSAALRYLASIAD